MDFESSIGDHFVIGHEEHLVSTLYGEGQVSEHSKQNTIVFWEFRPIYLLIYLSSLICL